MQITQTRQYITRSKQTRQGKLTSEKKKAIELNNFQEIIYEYIENGNHVEDICLYNELARIFDMVSTFSQA